MENELELRFDDEAWVYLPQVVAEENRRKANELERLASEEERIANENERVANEESRIDTMERITQEAENIIDEMNANLKKVSFIKTYKKLYTTTAENENTFILPEQYTETSMLDVRVNGFALNEEEYTLDLISLTISLTKPLDIGAVVEMVVTRLTTAHIEDYDSLFYDDTEIREFVEESNRQVEANKVQIESNTAQIEGNANQIELSTEKITALETEVGNISNVLDIINGESVV